jgi:hypothetical protein
MPIEFIIFIQVENVHVMIIFEKKQKSFLFSVEHFFVILNKAKSE